MNLPPDRNPEEPSGTFTLTRNERIALIFFFALALSYAIWQYFVDRQGKVDLGEDIPAGGVVVQVVGAVESPDLVYLPEGARVGDAIEAAGGFSSDADRGAVNLAEPVVDGQRIEVPYLDQTSRSDSQTRGSGGIRVPRIGGGTSRSTVSGPVNINTASAYDLRNLPEIGEQLASGIVEYRMQHGPFGTVEDIMNVDGIGRSRFEAIKDLITVAD